MTSISVVVCTFNRCDSLVETLESLKAMNVPPEIDWDIIVVDNNSTDRTHECVETSARTSKVTVRYALERTPGLSNARNLGIASSDKEFIAFTDDDVLVDRDWLKQIADTFERHHADCVGGKVLPHWLQQRPLWLADNLLNVLAMLDYGDTLFEFKQANDQRFLYGANFAFRRDWLARMGMFNSEAGRTGQFGGYEDKEMFEKLRQSGGKGIYNPAIVVLHKVFPTRLNKKYFRKWHYAAGKDRARITRACRFTVLGIESHLFGDFVKAGTELMTSVVRGRRGRLFSDELTCILYLSVFKHKVQRHYDGRRGTLLRASS